MRIIHVLPGMDDEASGPTYSVVGLCQTLIDTGEDVTLATIGSPSESSTPGFVKTFPLGVGPFALRRSPEMYRWLKVQTAAGEPAVIHSHGMWQMPTVYPGRVVKDTRTRLVVSPRGTFSKWAMHHGSRLKLAFWPVIQRPALAGVACFHATSEEEYGDIRRLGFEQPVAIIPNAIHIPPVVPHVQSGTRTLLFLGRIHPKKGVDILLKAWAAVMKRHPNWQLRVIGTDAGYRSRGGYLERMRTLAAELRLSRVSLPGPLYGQAKWSAYQEADLFVLPTHSENFGMTVAEALASGTPAIVSKGAPWAGLEAAGCGWWIDIGVDSLVATLEDALVESSETLERRGAKGRQWMRQEFSWETTCHRMARTYEWLVRGGEVPDWIREN